VRIAWIGLAPVEDSGSSYVATQLLRELAGLGMEIDCYAAAAPDAIHPSLRDVAGLRLVCRPSSWRAGRWYTRHPVTNHLAVQLTRIRAQARLARSMLDEHERRPYDVVYHYSQIELFALRRYRRKLPPIVVHPEAHAAGELHWHKEERDLARGGESLARHLVVRAMLQFRAATQRRDLRVVDRVIVPSRVFASLLATDYGVPLSKLAVVPNPINLERFHPPDDPAPDPPPVRLLFVARMSVRKGVELVVELSRRLADLSGRVDIAAIGPPDQWSDYRHLLSGLQPEIARYDDNLTALDVAQRYRSAHGILQPSRYEPFALSVGEALASGLPVVVSDAVGAGEDVDARCCFVFPSGDVDGFEDAVRRLVEIASAGRTRDELRALARTEAERLWNPATVAAAIAKEIEGLVSDGYGHEHA
jgi:glycosyltransferase involved in cell wall biosynthesis